MIDIFAKIGLINCIISVFMMMQILIKARKSRVNWEFILLAFSIAFWSFGYWRWLSSVEYVDALFWSKLFTVGSILIPFSFFLWAVSLLGLTKKYLLHLCGVLIIVLIFIYQTAFSDLVIRGLKPQLIFPFWPIAGDLYIYIVFFLYVGVISYSLGILLSRYRQVKEYDTRNQIKYIFWGSFIGFGGGLSNFFLWYDIFIPPYLNFLPALGLILFYYAGSKHRLFDIKVIATEFFVYVLWIAVLIRLVFANDFQDRIIDIISLGVLLFLGIRLIQSVRVEVEQRLKLQNLTDQLAKANEQLKQLDKARAEFISIASHQLRTPPATIKWYLAAVSSGDFGVLPESVKDPISKAERINNGLIRLIDDLLNVSRVERGKMEFLFEKTDIQKLAESVYEQLVPQAQEKNLKLVYIKPKGPVPEVIIDREKLKQVINNLVDNAIKYTKQGTVELSLLKGAGNVLIRVKDSGKGISKEETASIFQKYGRGKEAGKQASGLGLGLYLAKVVVEQHKGKIWVESKGVGKGSTFVVSLPIKTSFKHTEFDFSKH